MIGKLAAKDSGKVRQLKAQIHQTRGRGQTRGYRKIIRIGTDQTIGQTVEIEDSSGKTEVDTELSRVIGEIILGKIQDIMEDKAVEESIEVIIIEVVVMIEVGIGLEKGHFLETMTVIELGVKAIVDQGRDLELVQRGIE